MANVENNPNQTNLRTRKPQSYGYAQTEGNQGAQTPASTNLSQAELENRANYSQSQGQIFANLNSGGSGNQAPAMQGSFPAPYQYYNSQPQLGYQDPLQPPYETPAQSLTAADFQNKMLVQETLYSFTDSDPELNRLLNSPGKKPIWLIIAAVQLSKSQNQLERSLERVAKLGEMGKGPTDVDMTLATAQLTNDIRDHQRTTDFSTNMGKSVHDAQQNTIRNIRS